MSTNHAFPASWARKGVAALLLTLGAVVASAPAASALTTTPSGEVPFYARITTIGNPDQIYHDGTWAVVVFYRSPDCVPLGFNMLLFFDPGAFACTEGSTIGGTAYWHNGPGADPAPFLAVSHGLGDVPVWFVRWTELEPAVADGVLTITDLGAMSSLITGSASHYREVLQPHDAAPVPMTAFVARGTLSDGRSFSVNALFIEGVTIRTRITFGN